MKACRLPMPAAGIAFTAIAGLFLLALPGCTTSSWSQGQGARDLGPVTSRLCYLTRVSGHFEGGGEYVRVYQENGHWWLGGHSKQSGVGGKAVCVDRKLFSSGTQHDTAVSHDFHMAFHSASASLTGCDHETTGLKSSQSLVPAWNGNAATILNGMSGKFVGGAEYATVVQSPDPTRPSKLDVGTMQCSVTMQDWAVSFRIGDAGSSDLPQFIGPRGEGAINDAGEYAVHSTGTSQVPMAPVGEALCYFTRIAGKFRGGGEYVEIYAAQVGQNKKTWWLRAHNGSAGAPDGVYARARCLKFHQP